MRRVPRWWAGKGPAANPQIGRPAAKAQIIRSAPERREVVLSRSKSKIWRVPGPRAPHQRVPEFNHSRKRWLSNGHPNSRPTASRNTGTRSP
ncbi:hypothetical protein XcyCFBP4188_01890 [Xanthomonas hortorum pv. cynarae]|nr:hypothetical protein XcyCFBP4188_01890 [Xanthomonas hortorum pv. cynarae]